MSRSRPHVVAIALALAAEGAAVVCSDIHEAAREGGYERDIDIPTHEVIRKAGGRAEYLTADAGKAADVEALVAGAARSFGRLDIMVNNAGIFTGLHTILDETEEQYDATMAINAKGVWLGCKYAIAQMMRQEPGAEGSRAALASAFASCAGGEFWSSGPAEPWSFTIGSISAPAGPGSGARRALST